MERTGRGREGTHSEEGEHHGSEQARQRSGLTGGDLVRHLDCEAWERDSMSDRPGCAELAVLRTVCSILHDHLCRPGRLPNALDRLDHPRPSPRSNEQTESRPDRSTTVRVPVDHQRIDHDCVRS
jgi:hypothetical protein